MAELGNNNYIESFGEHENLTGKTLLASPIMDDEYFKRSVVYICAHDKDSAVGVMVNRVGSEINLHSSVGFKGNKDYSSVPLYSGGPVSVEKIIALTIRKNYYRGFNANPVITIFTELEDFRIAFNTGKIVKKFLVAQGITAWDSRQLTAEVNRNFWIVTNTTREAIFSHKKNLWKNEIKKLGLTENSKNIVNYTGQA